jgi:rare lipoprotein A
MKFALSNVLSKAGVCGALTALWIQAVAAEGELPRRPAAVPIAAQARSAAPAETGIASYYGAKYHGRATASGETFDMRALTAAHPRLAFGTRVKVTCLATQRSVVVRINDRGPFVAGRVIDLSLAAAEELQITKQGLATVRVEGVE